MANLQDINAEIGRISAAKANIIGAIEQKGVAVPADAMIQDLPQKILNISQSGSIVLDGQAITDCYEYLFEPTNAQSNFTITINHNLGKIPKLLYVIPEGDLTGTSYVLTSILALFNPSFDVVGLVGNVKLQVAAVSFYGVEVSAANPFDFTLTENTLSFNTGTYQVNPNVKLRFFIYA